MEMVQVVCNGQRRLSLLLFKRKKRKDREREKKGERVQKEASHIPSWTEWGSAEEEKERKRGSEQTTKEQNKRKREEGRGKKGDEPCSLYFWR